MTGSARVFTIPFGAPFLPILADAMLSGRLLPGWPDPADPLSLSAATVLTPTRRAARALLGELAARAGGSAVLLPKIVPLGDVEEAEDAALFDDTSAFAETGALAPAVSDTERRLTLAAMTLAWARAVDRAMLKLDESEALLVPASPADALALAGDLGRLIDSLAIHGRSWRDIETLTPDAFDDYWRITRDFLAIAARRWPDYCAERGVMDGAARRDRLLLEQAERLARDPPPGPVIAAGSTGSMPATAALLSAVARLPQGALVLQGLDTRLDAAAWRAVLGDAGADIEPHPTHPQALLAALLARLGVARGAVETIGREPPALAARAQLLSEALRPAAAAEAWASRADRLSDADIAAGLADIAVIEARDEREEALAIAIALREALEEPGRVAALATPDRGLAQRVAAELRRWNIEVDDSAGTPLRQTPHGVFAMLAADLAAAEFEPHRLLALLGHALARFGLPRAQVARARATLEIGVLRGGAIAPGLEALARALETRETETLRAARPKRRLTREDWALARDLIRRLGEAFAPLLTCWIEDLPAFVPAHLATLQAVAAPAPGESDDLFSGPDGEALAAVFDDLAANPSVGLPGGLADYPRFFAELTAGRNVASGQAGHRRVKIWGLLEARLLTADVMALGGLDEKTWPPETRADAFLNRPMRAELGLPAPERRIGQTAHDFCAALGARRVILARSAKAGGDPTVASRFLRRLAAVAGAQAWSSALARGERILALARALDRPAVSKRVGPPRPKPDPALIPRRVRVSEVETWTRDPYAIFARHILELDALDPIGRPPGAADRGILTHDILGRFAALYPTALPPRPYEILVALADEAFARHADHIEARSFWRPRFLRVAAYFEGWEAERRAFIREVAAEREGALAITLPCGEIVELRARADRIELLADGGFSVIDYKTGSPPPPEAVQKGFSPQLTLEAAMMTRGAFRALPAGARLHELLYLRLTGGYPPGEEKPIGSARQKIDAATLAETHLAAFTGMMNAYIRGERPFLSRPYARYAKAYNPYDHLARVRDWSLAGEEDSGEGET